jgi:hypothetical protein
MSQPPKGIQDVIHSLETGGVRAGLRWLLVALALVVALALYNFTEARNFSNPEAMETAQLARNLAEGRGYTTHAIMPITVRYLQERAVARGRPDPDVLRRPVPDLQHAPVYPVLLAAVFKVLPRTLRSGLPANVYQLRPWAELVITAFNFLWLGLGAALLYRLGRRMFDAAVGGFAAAVYAGAEFYWRAASNGLHTPFLICLLLLLWEVLTRLAEVEPPATTPVPGALPVPARLWRLAALAGTLLGLACLTRYAAGWLLVPVLVYVGWSCARRWLAGGVLLLAFLLVVAPWLARNYHLGGHLFGTAGAAAQADTVTNFPDFKLERLLKAPEERVDFTGYRVKFANNAAEILREGVPRLGGSWLTFLFFAGLLLPFQNRGLRQLRWFTLLALATLFVVEASGRTFLGRIVGPVNSENQLALLAPLFFLFGAAFLFSLIESTNFGHDLFRPLTVGAAWAVCCLPLLTALLPPRTYPLVDPFYRPDTVRGLAQYVGPDELMLSDVPWAVAWYGERPCLGTPYRVQSPKGDDFFAVHDFMRPIAALYLSPYVTEAPLRLLATKRQDHEWGWLYFEALLRRNLPTGFPLKHAYQGSAREGHLFLADRPRWNE